MNYEYPDLDERILKHCDLLQRAAVLKFVEARGGVAWWKVGEGKTRLGIFTFTALQNTFKWELPSICLVVCRRRAFYDMAKEIETCLGPETPVYFDECPIHPPGGRPVFLIVSSGSLAKVEAAPSFNKLEHGSTLQQSAVPEP